MRIDRGTVLVGVIGSITGAITTQLWQDMIGTLLNAFALQNNQINELKGQIGIILLLFTILCVGILIGKYAKRKDDGYVTGIDNKGKYKSNSIQILGILMIHII